MQKILGLDLKHGQKRCSIGQHHLRRLLLPCKHESVNVIIIIQVRTVMTLQNFFLIENMVRRQAKLFINGKLEKKTSVKAVNQS